MNGDYFISDFNIFQNVFFSTNNEVKTKGDYRLTYSSPCVFGFWNQFENPIDTIHIEFLKHVHSEMRLWEVQFCIESTMRGVHFCKPDPRQTYSQKKDLQSAGKAL